MAPLRAIVLKQLFQIRRNRRQLRILSYILCRKKQMLELCLALLLITSSQPDKAMKGLHTSDKSIKGPFLSSGLQDNNNTIQPSISSSISGTEQSGRLKIKIIFRLDAHTKQGCCSEAILKTTLRGTHEAQSVALWGRKYYYTNLCILCDKLNATELRRLNRRRIMRQSSSHNTTPSH